jgi:hypothetical protein
MSSSTIASLARGILIPVAVGLVFSLSRRYFSSATDDPLPDDVANDMSSKQLPVALAMFLVIACSGYSSYRLLIWLNHFVIAMRGNALVTLYPESAIWWFLPGFGSVVCCWEIALRLWSLFDRRTAETYAIWSDQKAGFRATELLRLLGLWIVFPIAVLTMLAIPLGTSFFEDGISIGKYGSLQPRHYNYADIQKITVVRGLRLRDGSLQVSPAITLDFKDGSRWSSADNRGRQRSIDERLLHLLEEKTDLAPEVIDALRIRSYPTRLAARL